MFGMGPCFTSNSGGVAYLIKHLHPAPCQYSALHRPIRNNKTSPCLLKTLQPSNPPLIPLSVFTYCCLSLYISPYSLCCCCSTLSFCVIIIDVHSHPVSNWTRCTVVTVVSQSTRTYVLRCQHWPGRHFVHCYTVSMPAALQHKIYLYSAFHISIKLS